MNYCHLSLHQAARIEFWLSCLPRSCSRYSQVALNQKLMFTFLPHRFLKNPNLGTDSWNHGIRRDPQVLPSPTPGITGPPKTQTVCLRALPKCSSNPRSPRSAFHGAEPLPVPNLTSLRCSVFSGSRCLAPPSQGHAAQVRPSCPQLRHNAKPILTPASRAPRRGNCSISPGRSPAGSWSSPCPATSAAPGSPPLCAP